MAPLLTSKLLLALDGVRHGFSVRDGGVSKGPFASLNLGANVGDDPEAVLENRRRFARALGADTVREVDQVHGDRVVDVDSSAHMEQADAIVSRRRGVGIAVRTADCAPILLVHAVDGIAHQVAAVHAGWRGATLRIVERAIETLGAPTEEIFAAVGPTIGFDAFEVGPEVVAAARESVRSSPPARPAGDGKWRLDLRELIVIQLEELGVARMRVERVGGCTHTERNLFFSHRRDRGRTGRHAAGVTLTGQRT